MLDRSSFLRFPNFFAPAGEEKPKLQEVGPYAYRQVLTKEDVKFTEVGKEGLTRVKYMFPG